MNCFEEHLFIAKDCFLTVFLDHNYFKTPMDKTIGVLKSLRVLGEGRTGVAGAREYP